MKNKRSVAVIDVKILDTFEGAQFIRDLEQTENINFVYAVFNPNDKCAETLDTHGAVVRNTGNLNSRDFWEAVFEFVDNGLNEIVAVGAHYNQWGLLNQAAKHRVPFKFVYNVDNKRMQWL